MTTRRTLPAFDGRAAKVRKRDYRRLDWKMRTAALARKGAPPIRLR
jgi:hypothetical protein